MGRLPYSPICFSTHNWISQGKWLSSLLYKLSTWWLKPALFCELLSIEIIFLKQQLQLHSTVMTGAGREVHVLVSKLLSCFFFSFSPSQASSLFAVLLLLCSRYKAAGTQGGSILFSLWMQWKQTVSLFFLFRNSYLDCSGDQTHPPPAGTEHLCSTVQDGYTRCY